MGLWPLVYWDWGFETRGYEYLSPVRVLCVLEGRGLCDGPIARPESPTLCSVSECDLDTSTIRRATPTRAVEPRRKVCNPLPSLRNTQLFSGIGFIILSFHEVLLTKRVFACSCSMQYSMRPSYNSGNFSFLFLVAIFFYFGI